MKCYPILDGEKKIGDARISKEGMFLRIECVCVVDEKIYPRIYLIGSQKQINLGVCVGNGKTKTLIKRMACRNFPEGNIVICTCSRDYKRSLLVNGMELEDISALKYARIQKEGDCIWLVYDQSNSSPTGQ